MPMDESFELEPFQWAQRSSVAHTKTLHELADLKARASGQQATVSKLQAQLDDFIKTKRETEQEMLQQFMILLNEKKRKIRDQNRLLAGAKVNQSTGKLPQYTGITQALTWWASIGRKDITRGHEASKSCRIAHFQAQSNSKGPRARTGAGAGRITRSRPNGDR